ncbi:MAG: HNH endonuclease [Ignavibacteriales bacterium]
MFEVHHIATWSERPDLRLDVGNLSLLCGPCHDWVHSSSNERRLFLRT